MLLSFLLSSTMVFAAPAPTADALAQDFETAKQKVEQSEMRQRQVLSSLYQINRKIKKTVTQRGKLQQEKVFVESSIAELNEKIDEIDHRANSQKAILAERLKVIYRLGGQSLARLFLNSTSSAQLGRNLKILGVVAGHDRQMIQDYIRDVEDLKSKKFKLASRLEHLKKVETRIAQKEKSFLIEQTAKNKILDRVRRGHLFAVNKINSLRAQSLQYNLDDSGLYDMLFRPSFQNQKGNLPGPVQGVVVQKFGLVKSPDHPYTLNQKGIFISSAQGNPIQSIFEGKVSFAGELPGFGKTIIVDHGDHYYSVYAHAKELKVRTGDEVTQSQTVATVGRSVSDQKDGVYFEIRHFSEPYDPQPWMKGFNL